MKGIAIGPILFVIAILAVLVSALASGSGGFSSGTSAERAKVIASSILAQAYLLRQGVERVQTYGCADTEISFDNSVVSGYANPNAPLASKPWCNVFNPQGGQLTWIKPPRETGSSSVDWFFRTIRIYQVGGDQSFCTESSATPCVELIAMLPDLSDVVCGAINLNLHGTSTITTQDNGDNYETGSGSKFAGAYIMGSTDLDGSGVNAKTARCTKTPTNRNYFYFVLVAR